MDRNKVMLLQKDVAPHHRDGYLPGRRLLSTAEAERFRNDCLRTCAKPIELGDQNPYSLKRHASNRVKLYLLFPWAAELVRQRTMLVNAIRAHCAEFGIVAAQGRRKVKDLITGLDNTEIPELARLALWQIADQINECDKHIDALERRILAWHKSDEASRNLATIPGLGPITASAMAATVPHPSAFRNGRQLAAWLGLVPRQNSSGGKDRLSGITRPATPISAVCW